VTQTVHQRYVNADSKVSTIGRQWTAHAQSKIVFPYGPLQTDIAGHLMAASTSSRVYGAPPSPDSGVTSFGSSFLDSTTAHHHRSNLHFDTDTVCICFINRVHTPVCRLHCSARRRPTWLRIFHNRRSRRKVAICHTHLYHRCCHACRPYQRRRQHR
jgi:hypothetical protein